MVNIKYISCRHEPIPPPRPLFVFFVTSFVFVKYAVRRGGVGDLLSLALGISRDSKFPNHSQILRRVQYQEFYEQCNVLVNNTALEVTLSYSKSLACLHGRAQNKKVAKGAGCWGRGKANFGISITDKRSKELIDYISIVSRQIPTHPSPPPTWESASINPVSHPFHF